MPISPCYLFKNSFEFKPREDFESVPAYVRGIYVLYERKDDGAMDVVYIGMARGEQSGARGRLRKHLENPKKVWSHFSVYQVWDNIPKEQIEELEGLFRHLYRKDSTANRFNVQKTYGPLARIRRKGAEDWI